jgi:serine/threonine protein phosphatase PrpC
MGGHAGGEVASKIAVDSISEFLETLLDDEA